MRRVSRSRPYSAWRADAPLCLVSILAPVDVAPSAVHLAASAGQSSALTRRPASCLSENDSCVLSIPTSSTPVLVHSPRLLFAGLGTRLQPAAALVQVHTVGRLVAAMYRDRGPTVPAAALSAALAAARWHPAAAPASSRRGRAMRASPWCHIACLPSPRAPTPRVYLS